MGWPYPMAKVIRNMSKKCFMKVVAIWLLVNVHDSAIMTHRLHVILMSMILPSFHVWMLTFHPYLVFTTSYHVWSWIELKILNICLVVCVVVILNSNDIWIQHTKSLLQWPAAFYIQELYTCTCSRWPGN